jgi:hypothetical protein
LVTTDNEKLIECQLFKGSNGRYRPFSVIRPTKLTVRFAATAVIAPAPVNCR